MNLIRRLLYAPEAVTGLCRKCIWSTARRGFNPAEAEVFCRFVGPNSPVRYAVRECNCYAERPQPPKPAPEPTPQARKYGFVTEIKLEDGSSVEVIPDEASAKQDT
jgi:hypothetical protein